MDQLSFKATLHKISFDKEGEAKIILTVPKSYLVMAAKMTAMTESVLSVSVGVEE